MTGLGNEAQSRAIADQVALAAVDLYARTHPIKQDMPAPLKWAGGIIAAVASACTVAMAIWVVSTLSGLQQTVTRIDERQQITGDNTGKRMDELERRVATLESFHQQRSGQ